MATTLTTADQILERWWERLLELRQRLNDWEEPLRLIGLSRDQIWLNPKTESWEEAEVLVAVEGQEVEVSANVACFQPLDLFRLKQLQLGKLEPSISQLLVEYLPYALLPRYATQTKRAIAVSHFAQSLDGKIATNCGDSRWIGNPGNLLHAHRMRALLDGIMIGTRTLQNDQPSLTVRLVTGPNPRRIVLSSSARDFSSLFASSPDPVLVLGNGEPASGDNLEYERLPAASGHIPCQTILEHLYQKGIRSVYIEGGSETTSHFLREHMIDIMQLHLSPRVFGSGISGIVLPEIEEVRQCVSFEHFAFMPVGDSVMFVGEPRWNVPNEPKS
ncbi:MAG: RibD family protein [Bacteroidota bacterium]